MQVSRIHTSPGYSPVRHLAALALALCMGLALTAFTIPTVYAATAQHAGIQAAASMTRGGGGGHGGGGHSGAGEGGTHVSTSEGGTLHSSEENTGGSGSGFHSYGIPFSHNSTSSGQGGDVSVLAILIALTLVAAVLALIIYLNWRRVRLQHKG